MASAGAEEMTVSCLMVTLPSPRRFAHLQRSIAAYCAQTHGRRELVVLFDLGPAEARTAITRHVASLGRDDIRLVESTERLSLGGLRNLSRERADGEVQCQWDDDDFYHPQRLAAQLAGLACAGAQAAYLQEVMQFFPATRQLYCSNWRATEYRAHPGTLMCLRSAAFHYPEVALAEDSDVALQLQRQGGLHLLAGAPHLHVYVSHGDNSWAGEHHQMLARELGLSQALLRRREAALRDGLAPFDFGPEAVTVQGYNGPAFTLDPVLRPG